MKRGGRLILGALCGLLAGTLPAAGQQAAQAAGQQLAQQAAGQWMGSGQSGSAVRPGAHARVPTLIEIPVSGCPVSLRAQHKADGSVMQARAVGHATIGQWLHLTLANPEGRTVASALVTIRGFSGKPRMTQTSSHDGGAGRDGGTGRDGDASRTMTVNFSTRGEAAQADVWVAQMSAVQRIEIQSVTLNDGAVWNLAGDGCHVAPDLFMDVAAR